MKIKSLINVKSLVTMKSLTPLNPMSTHKIKKIIKLNLLVVSFTNFLIRYEKTVTIPASNLGQLPIQLDM